MFKSEIAMADSQEFFFTVNSRLNMQIISTAFYIQALIYM